MLTSLNTRIITIGTICAIVWGFISAMSKGFSKLWCQLFDKITFHLASTEIFKMANGFYYQVDNDKMPTVIFLLLFVFLFVLVLYLIVQVERRPVDSTSIILIVFFSILFRFILLPSEPIHENDFYRYMWDGKTMTNYINPYKYAPSDLFMYEYGYKEDYYDVENGVMLRARDFSMADQQRLEKLTQLRDQNLLFYERIGHWQVPTIYPPVTQGVFFVVSLIKQDSFVFMKFCFMLFDIGVIILIIALLKQFGKNPGMVLVYGWSPLVLKEFPNSGHYDPVVIFFTMLSIYLLFRDQHIKGYVALGMATLSKFFSAVLLPLFIRLTRWRQVPYFFIVLIFLYLPFLWWNDTNFQEIFQGLSTYNEEWAYNASIFAIIYVIMDMLNPAWTESLITPKLVSGALYLVVLLYLMALKSKGRLELLHRFFVAIAALFIINPVGDPWYFCWCIPFLCFFPYRSWILLSGLLIFSYLNFQSYHAITDIRWFNIPVLNWMIYMPFFILAIFEWMKKPPFISFSDE